MSKKIRYLLLGVLTALLPMTNFAYASSHEFYKDKTVRIVVGFAAGGGFDLYARTIARHMGRHIPGNPTIIVENMPGAGGVIAANHLYKAAKPDGLTMGNFQGGLLVLLGQMLGRPGIEFDTLKFEYVGVPVKDSWVCALTKASGVTNMEQWMAAKTPVKLGGVSASATDDIAKVLKETLNLPIQLVTGYKGTADIRLAAEAGEVAGGCWNWESIKTTWAKGVESGEVVVVLQIMPRPHPELSKVPQAINFAKTEEARQLIKVGIQDTGNTSRLYALPPGTPKERVRLMRKAFADTMKDPEFLAEAKKSRLDIDPETGEEVEKTIAGLVKLSPAHAQKLKEILK
jgi:tripartite-type tricarboxylate transporter receptor subunit TctC